MSRSRTLHVLGLLAATVVAAALWGIAAPAASAASNIVISQAYGGGGNTGATFTNDFIEVFNRGLTTEPLNGWSVQYGSSSGLIGPNANQITPLSGFIAPGQYVLVQEAAGTGVGVALSPDITDDTPTAMAAAAGKVALVNTTTGLNCGSSTIACSAAALATVVDLVGYGTANQFEGSGPAPAPSNTTSVLRNGGGCVDTDSNAGDLAAGVVTPRNRLSTLNYCSGDSAPTITARTPDDGATSVSGSSNVSVTFSEPVTVTDPWFTISCVSSGTHAAAASGGPTTFTLDATTDFAPGEACTVTISGGQVSDQDTLDPPDTLLGDPSWSFTTAEPNPVVISEVYGGGGNTGAFFKNDFVELYNRSSHAVSLAGWSVQYASAAGTTWQVTALAGSIPAGRNYLVQEAAGTGGAVDLPAPDATGTIAMGATAGKVALVSSTDALTSCPPAATIVDFVGYGTTASCFEGSGRAPAPSNTTSDQRNGGGASDTDDNAADFTVVAPDPRASGDQAPKVASTSPAPGATGVALDTNVSITFSEPVSVSDPWFTISCADSGSHAAAASGGPTTFSLDPSASFAPNESCTVTISAAGVADQDADDPPDAMAADHVLAFQTADVLVCGSPATAIHTIQGGDPLSPRAGSGATIEGVIVGDYQQVGGFGGFYVQEEDAQVDADPETSEGIFVFSSLADVARGDLVRVRGTVTEFATGTSRLTELTSVNAITTCSTGNPLPTTADVTLPVSSMADFERYEGMRVHFPQTLTATETFTLARFGEVRLAAGGRLFTPTAVAAPGAPAIAQEDLNQRRSFVLDDGDNRQNIDPTIYPSGGLSAANTLRSGYTVAGLDGVFDERFSTYRVQPAGPTGFAAANPRTAAPDAVGGNLRVASFNVLNFFNGDGAGGGFPTSRGANTQFEYDRQKAKEVAALSSMDADIVGLMEMENDAPPNSAIEDLVAGLNAAMGAGTYSFVDTGVIGTDEIKVALIYKPASVTPVGAYRIITSGVDPRFIDTKNRPSLAQTFVKNSNGAKLTVVVNHLKSKGSACEDVGDPDIGDGQSNCNLTRKHAAQAIVEWLATDPTGSGDSDFLLIGDMNSYTFEDPIAAFTDGGFTNLARQFGGLDAYSYVFGGESGYLDHALASASLAPQATGATHWHINADEPIALDYNVEFKQPGQVVSFYAPDAYRASDHDPVVIGFDLNAPPTVNAGGPYAVAEGGAVTVSATGNDPDGDPLAYEWDLDDDGIYETAGQSVTFSAAAIDGPAMRAINARVNDGHGHAADSPATVQVQNAEPAATFDAPATATAGVPFTISLTSPSDPAPADTFTYAFDCGSGYSGFGTASSASCTALDTGPLTVRAKIQDDDGASTQYTATVPVTVTFDSLCALTREYSSNAGLADDLCAELAAAQHAEQRSNAKSKQQHLAAYTKAVNKQAGKAFTVDEAATLTRLASRL